jgi:hypothetical protein
MLKYFIYCRKSTEEEENLVEMTGLGNSGDTILI